MKHHDVNSNKILDFPPNTVYSVYTRRSNCVKRLIHSGKDINAALKAYHSFKVFQQDYKYLFYTYEGKEVMLYRTSGEGSRPNYQGKKLLPNHRSIPIQVNGIPETLYKSFKESLVGIRDKDNFSISVTSTLPVLMAYFIQLTDDDRKTLIASMQETIIKNMILSGGDNTKEVRDYLISETDELL